MAGEYFRWKYRDVKPEEHRELTSAEKRRNWWEYHKWHVVIGIISFFFLTSILWDMLGIGVVHPDYQITYVGADPLPEDTVAALEAALSELGEDLNGDGQVVVTLHQCATYANLLRQESEAGEVRSDETVRLAQASQINLIADIQAADSFLFLLDDPKDFQEGYTILSYPDGALPEEGDLSADGTYLAWTECPVLSALDLGNYAGNFLSGDVTIDHQDIMSRLYIARRGFWSDKTCENLEGCEALWAKLREGTIP